MRTPDRGDLVQAAPLRPDGLDGLGPALVIDTGPGPRVRVWWFGLGPPELVATTQTVPTDEMRLLGPAAQHLGPAGRRALAATATHPPHSPELAARIRAALD